jgi:hypothetical protein
MILEELCHTDILMLTLGPPELSLILTILELLELFTNHQLDLMIVTLELLLFMVEVLDTLPREEQLLDHPPMVAQKEELS